MATEKIKSRIQLKYDTLENWNKATNFIPYEGEICIYSDISSLKVGDGETKINDLPFMGDELITDDEIQLLFNKTTEELFEFIIYYPDGSAVTCFTNELIPWKDWVNSKYNTLGLYHNPEAHSISLDGYTQLYYLSQSQVWGGDFIAANMDYYLITNSGSAEPT